MARKELQMNPFEKITAWFQRSNGKYTGSSVEFSNTYYEIGQDLNKAKNMDDMKIILKKIDVLLSYTKTQGDKRLLEQVMAKTSLVQELCYQKEMKELCNEFKP